MNDTDQLFERVVKEGGKSPEEVREMIEKRKAATHGLLSDYGALYAVAKEWDWASPQRRSQSRNSQTSGLSRLTTSQEG